MTIRVAILTISDGVASGVRQDLSGTAIAEHLSGDQFEIVERRIVQDEQAAIRDCLIAWADAQAADVVLTTGGTGMSTRDVTPEATLDACERLAPGMAEAMRQRSREKTPFAMLSRAVVGIRRETLIVNLPGSPKGAVENLEVVLPVLTHAISTLHGATHEADSGTAR